MPSHGRRRLVAIYLITHEPTGSVYVGKSLDVAMRWNGHLHALLFGNHHNKGLMSLLEAGAHYSDFAYSIIKVCSKKTLAVVEKALIAQYCESHGDKCLNVSGRPKVKKEVKLQEETK